MEILADNNLIKIFTNPQNLIMIGGLIFLLVIIYLETGFFLGLILPGGDYLVFTAGLLAGASRLSLKRFSLYNVLGAIIWIGSLAPLGYFLGNEFPGMIDYSIYFLIGFVILASAPVLISFFKPRKANEL